MKSPAQKLSKSDGDTGVKDLRAAGWTREQVLSAASPSTFTVNHSVRNQLDPIPGWITDSDDVFSR
jgi:glutamyl/glutaminyl-tRNA synthetase